MRASEWEFRHRFWLISALFTASFLCYRFDRVNTGVALVKAFAPSIDIDSPHGRHVLQALFGFAALLCALAAWLRSWASAYLRSEIVHDTAVHTEGLVADGPYRFVRNPLYLGNILLSLGMAFLESRVGAVLLIVGQTLFLLRLIGREEQALSASEGARFEAYRAAVPSLMPSPVPRVPASGLKPRWVQGVIGEAFMWIIAGSVLAFALTLVGRVVPISVGFGFVVYWILFAIWKRKLRARTSQ